MLTRVRYHNPARAERFAGRRTTQRRPDEKEVVFMIELLSLLLATTVFFPPAAEGEFIGRVVVEWLIDEDADRTMRLVEDFAFRDSDGKVWRVPAGAEIDGASIPVSLYSIIGPPFVGDYRRASVVHDHFCRERIESWKAVHRMFYEGVLAGGVPRLLAKTMYMAVRGFGPRWEARVTRDGTSRVVPIPRPPPDASVLADLEAWIAENDPALGEIDTRLAERLGEATGAAGS